MNSRTSGAVSSRGVGYQYTVRGWLKAHDADDLAQWFERLRPNYSLWDAPDEAQHWFTVPFLRHRVEGGPLGVLGVPVAPRAPNWSVHRPDYDYRRVDRGW